VRYYWLDTGKGEAASVSVFSDKAGADEPVHLAADYVKEHLSKSITQKPEIIEGTDQRARLSAQTISATLVGVRAASQRWIPTRERSGLLTRIAAMKSVSSFAQMNC
jgi:hypothetical protein